MSADLAAAPSNEPKPLQLASSEPYSDDPSDALSLSDASSDICGSLAWQYTVVASSSSSNNPLDKP